MAFDTTNTPDPYAGVRRLAARMEAKMAWHNALIAKAKGGNPNKLVSARDLHKHAFAQIDAAYRKAVK